MNDTQKYSATGRLSDDPKSSQKGRGTFTYGCKLVVEEAKGTTYVPLKAYDATADDLKRFRKDDRIEITGALRGEKPWRKDDGTEVPGGIIVVVEAVRPHRGPSETQERRGRQGEETAERLRGPAPAGRRGFDDRKGGDADIPF